MAANGEVTELLHAWNEGDPAALEEILPLVYTDLQRLAHALMRGERQDHTLQATALVHEAFLHLPDQRRVDWRGRRHFIAVAATLMRRVLMHHARARRALKRGGDQRPLRLEETQGGEHRRSEEILAVGEALDDLAALDPRQARVVELRVFGGFSVAETASLLELSTATIKREWRLAAAWLKRRLGA